MEPTEKRFVQRMRELLVSLPYDLKVLFEATSDENLPIQARELAAGAAIYCLSPSDPLPDSMGLIGFIDDVVVLRFAFARMLDLAGEDGDSYRERFSEQLERLQEDLALIRSYLADAADWLEDRLEKMLLRLRYKGKDAKAYVSDDGAGEFLYEEGQEFVTHYEIDEEQAAKLQSGKAILEALRQRKEDESRRIA